MELPDVDKLRAEAKARKQASAMAAAAEEREATKDALRAAAVAREFAEKMAQLDGAVVRGKVGDVQDLTDGKHRIGAITVNGRRVREFAYWGDYFGSPTVILPHSYVNVVDKDYCFAIGLDGTVYDSPMSQDHYRNWFQFGIDFDRSWTFCRTPESRLGPLVEPLRLRLASALNDAASR